MISLSEDVIRASCGKRVWDRAEELLQWPALSGMFVCGEDAILELFGGCTGSEGQDYAVRVCLRNGVLGDSSCSCLYDGRGPCKHRVALMLAFVRQNKNFQKYPSLIEMIAECSEQTLRDLVVTLVRRSPDLLPLVAASRGGGEEPIGETLKRALSGRTASDGAPVLERVFGEASQLEAKGEWFAAGELYSVALEHLAVASEGFEKFYNWEVERSDGYYDESGDFGNEWAAMAVEGLGRAFDVETLAPEAKRKWAGALWKAESAAREREYFGLPARARDLLSRFAPDELWAYIEATLRAHLKHKPRQRSIQAHAMGRGTFGVVEIPAGDDWSRGKDIEFLLSGLRARGRDEEADALVAELGTTKQQFELKLRQGDLKGAQRLANQNYAQTPPRLAECATQLEEVGAPELALEMMFSARKRGMPSDDFDLLPAHAHTLWETWLCDFYLRHHRAPEARAEAVVLFARTPNAEQFARLKSAVEMGGTWSVERDAVEREVRSHAGKRWGGQSRQGEVALALALQEQDAPRVYSLFKKFTRQERPQFLEAVADAIEGELPAEALALWRELAEWRIENRDTNSARRNYVAASQALKRARELHKKLGSMEEWKDYIGTFRGVYKSLRALQDELKKAGL